MENSIELSGLFVQPIADRIRAGHRAGKIAEDDLERALTSTARAIVDHAIDAGDWAPIEDVEGMLDLVADQMGGEVGLVEWAEEWVEGWLDHGPLGTLVRDARSLVDAPGFVISQASERLVRHPDWTYDGGRSAFCVRLLGVAPAGPRLKALLGAVLARLALGIAGNAFDVRVDGVDTDDLVVFGELERAGDLDAADESRLYRAALIG